MSEAPANLPTAEPIERAFRFCPRCGEANDEPGKIPFSCPHCGMALFFGPVAAVGGLIVDDQGRLLMVRRVREPGKGCWGLPGGFVDRDETIEQALEREVSEETNLRINRSRLLMTYPNHYDYRGVVAPVIDLFYECEISNPGELRLAADELDYHEWTEPSAKHLKRMAFPSNKVAIEYWLAHR